MTNEDSAYPLTRFLTALSHSPELLRAFREDPVRVARSSGVEGEQLAALQSGDLAQIQAAVTAELQMADAAATVGYWVMVDEEAQAAGFKVPDWWIRI